MTLPGTITAATPAAPPERAVWRAEIIETVKLAWPIALTQLGQIAMMTTDLALIGRLGDGANIDQRGREAGAEQIEAWGAEGAVDQGISEQPVHGDGSDGDPQRWFRTINCAHEVAQRNEAPGRDHRPCQSGQ